MVKLWPIIKGAPINPDGGSIYAFMYLGDGMMLRMFHLGQNGMLTVI